MNYQVKLFHWPERGDHVILIACGFVDINGFKQMFSKVGEITVSLSDCKVLIDLVDATYDLDPVDIKAFVSAITPDLLPINPKIALVSTPRCSSGFHSCCWPPRYRTVAARLPPFTIQSPL